MTRAAGTPPTAGAQTPATPGARAPGRGPIVLAGPPQGGGPATGDDLRDRLPRASGTPGPGLREAGTACRGLARGGWARAVAVAGAAAAAGAGLLVGLVGLLVPLVVAVGALAGLVAPGRARPGATARTGVGGRAWHRAVRVTTGAARAELTRIADATGVILPAPSPTADPPAGSGDVDPRHAGPALWRRGLYWLLRAPASLAQASALAVGIVVPFFAAVGATAVFFPHPEISLVGQISGHTVIGARWAAGIGVLSVAVMIAAAIVLPTWLRALDVGMARALLADTDTERLQASVDHLRHTREQAVDSAEAERRRIERDLHDGAQQRLVALSMILGRAQARLDPADDEALTRLLREARTETTTAIGEIRDLTRGLHPPVLTDRGLDAALSAVAARAPIPVDVAVDLPRRPSITLEAVVYFAVSEALTNVAKHARASRAWVRIEEVDAPTGPLLRAVVVDDGVGGADPAHGTGLRGLSDRLAGVDGRLELTSPAGGPTEFVVEVPCVS